MSGWDSERVYHSGDDYFGDLLRDIAGAKTSIHFQTYIFLFDSVGREVLEALKAAVRRGVSVQLLIDGAGSRNWNDKKLETHRAEGLHIRIFKPLPWQTRQWRRGPWSRVFTFFRALLTRFHRLNRRNHVKVCIIDESIAFIGGINIDARESEKKSGRLAWRDSAARVTGPEVSRLLKFCEHSWNPHARLLSRSQTPPLRSLIRVNFPRRYRNLSYSEFVNRILSAHHRIWLATPYFVPDRTLLRALKYASWRGLDVKLLVPSRSDIPLMTLVNRYFYRSLLKAGVDIHEYSPRFLHAKVSLIDDWAMVGSSNLNQRSLIHDREMDVILRHPESLETLGQQFLRDLEQAPVVTLRRRRPLRRAFQRVLILFRNWL